MKVHRFIGDFDLSGQKISVTDPDIVHQIVRVLRLHADEHVVLCDGRSHEIEGRIIEVAKDGVRVDVIDRRENRAEPENDVTLFCALLKREHFDLVAEKATEVGVNAIVPIVSRRTIKTEVKRERIERILKEAAEQSGRGRVPKLGEMMTLEESLAYVADFDRRVFFDVGAPIGAAPLGGRVAAFIGPEGGWDLEEVAAAKAAGCDVRGLGARVLRAETAAIIAAYLAVQGGVM